MPYLHFAAGDIMDASKSRLLPEPLANHLGLAGNCFVASSTLKLCAGAPPLKGGAPSYGSAMLKQTTTPRVQGTNMRLSNLQPPSLIASKSKIIARATCGIKTTPNFSLEVLWCNSSPSCSMPGSTSTNTT